MTDKNLKYDAQDLQAIQSTGRMDASESIHFARQLEVVKSQTYDVKRPMLSALALMPIDTSVSEGAETVTYRQFDTVGMAKVIANYADDLPRADVSAKEFTTPVRGIGISYGYSMQEIRASALAGTQLDARKARAAMKGHEETINKLAWSGDAAHGLVGFLNQPNIPAVVIPADGSGSSKTFASKTADQILRDMFNVVNSVEITTKGIHRATELWMPIEQYAYISVTPRSATSDTTILEFFQKNRPSVTVKQIVELDGAGTAGADVMIAIENSIDNYAIILPMMFRQHAPQLNGLEYTVPCESRFGGLQVYYPLAMAKAEGI